MANCSEIAAIERAVDDAHELTRENELLRQQLSEVGGILDVADAENVRLREELRKAQQTIRELQYRDSARFAQHSARSGE